MAVGVLALGLLAAVPGCSSEPPKPVAETAANPAPTPPAAPAKTKPARNVRKTNVIPDEDISHHARREKQKQLEGK